MKSTLVIVCLLSALATGPLIQKRTHAPLTIVKEWGPATPKFKTYELPLDENFAADLSKRAVVYEFDSSEEQVDFARVQARTRHGRATVKSLLVKAVPESDLAGVMSGRFQFGTIEGFRKLWDISSEQTKPPEPTPCERGACKCEGERDCKTMLRSGVCDDNGLFVYDRGGFGYCNYKYQQRP